MLTNTQITQATLPPCPPTLAHIEPLVLTWAADRNFFAADGATLSGQYLKSIEELGELAHAAARKKPDAIKDAIGDLMFLCMVQNKLAYTKPYSYFSVSSLPCITDLVIAQSDAAEGITELLHSLSGLIESRNRRGTVIGFIGTLAAVAEQHGLTLVECLWAAYCEVKDRKGVMRSGVFIKEADYAQSGLDSTGQPVGELV